MIRFLSKAMPEEENREIIAKWGWNLAKFVLSIGIGVVGCWFYVNMNSGPGVVITSQEEAEGPQFSDPRQLDVVVRFARNRVCPAVTQRWVWRWIEYQGTRMQQAIPMQATATPFLADTDRVLLTLPNPGVPDLSDKWFYRTVTTEQCGILPGSANAILGNRIYRSVDKAVNFIGEPHGK